MPGNREGERVVKTAVAGQGCANFESQARSVFEKDSSGTRMRAMPNRVPAAHLHAVFALPRCCGPDATISGICGPLSSHARRRAIQQANKWRRSKSGALGKRFLLCAPPPQGARHTLSKNTTDSTWGTHHSPNISDCIQIVHHMYTEKMARCRQRLSGLSLTLVQGSAAGALGACGRAKSGGGSRARPQAR